MSAEQPDLSAEQIEAAKQAGMTPEQFVAWAQVETVDDFEALQAARP